jgi:hypothetical protein
MAKQKTGKNYSIYWTWMPEQNHREANPVSDAFPGLDDVQSEKYSKALLVPIKDFEDYDNW